MLASQVNKVGEGHSGPSEEELPIDIYYKKLLEWLVDRKQTTPSWQQQSMAIRAKITSAIEDMPEVEEITQLLKGTYINYFHCLRIVELLKVSESSTRNFFGGYSSKRMKDWTEVVRLYEKDGVYLGECAHMLQRDVNYEVPALKKHIQKCQQQLKEIERRRQEYAASARAYAGKFAASCKELGIPGENIRRELLALVQELPLVFRDIAEAARSEGVRLACRYYDEFVGFVLGGGGASNFVLLETVRRVQNAPEEPVETMRAHVDAAVASLAAAESKSAQAVPAIDFGDGAAPAIDFGGDAVVPSIDFGGTPTIDFGDADAPKIDFGDVGAPNIDFGDAPSIDFGDGDGPKIDFGDAGAPTIDFGDSPADATSGDGAAIDWSGDGIDWGGDAGTAGIVVESSGAVLGGVAGVDATGAQLLDVAEVRNRFMDELLELQGFLAQRLKDAERSDVISMQQMQRAPAFVQSQSHQTHERMKSAVDAVVVALEAPRTKHLMLMKASPRYVERLEESLVQKLKFTDKMTENSAKLDDKQRAIESQIAETLPKLTAVIERTKTLQRQLEKDLSRRYNNRTVNIIGEINTM